MENASKALLMAGGILIALLILGALILLANNLADYQNKQDVSTKESQIAEYNNQFEPYNKQDLSLMELKSLYNKIESNNKLYPEFKIETNIKEIYTDITKDFKQISEEDKQRKVFSCIKMERNGEEGRINEMSFEDVTPPIENP